MISNKKISQALIDSHDTRPQIYGSLIMRNPETREVEKYCAIGALACEAGLVGEDFETNYHNYNLILKEYGIKSPERTYVEMPKGQDEGQYLLSSAIWHLNDHYKWNFKKIGKWLARLEKKGVIKYEKEKGKK